MAEARRPLGEGAAQEAPTAPHATPHAGKGKRTGPERFWARWPVRIVFGLSLIVSGAAHCAVVPFDLPTSFEINDSEGEATIPIDMLEQEDPPEPPPPPAATEGPSEADRAREAAAAAAAKLADAGPLDGAADVQSQDAAADAPVDAPKDAPVDAPSDGPSDGGASLDGAIALTDAGSTPRGPADPKAMLGVAGDIQADVTLVFLAINAEEIKKNPVGVRLGALLRGIPQWDEFMDGTDIDPVRDTVWVMISGPSLVDTSRDSVIIRYSADDATIDKAVAVVSKKYDRGGPIDAGVPGVKASIFHADRAARALIRPQTHVLAVVPTNIVAKAARNLAPPHPIRMHLDRGQAFYMKLVDPGHPLPELFPRSITELRMRIMTRADDGADIFIECDTKDPATAEQAADQVRRTILRYAGLSSAASIFGMGYDTDHLLDNVEVTTDGKLVKIHRTATRHQIEMVARIVAQLVGVHLSAPPAGP